MINVIQFQEMVGISELELQAMSERQDQTLAFFDEFVHELKNWFNAHDISPDFPDLDQAIKALYQTIICNGVMDNFYESISKPALQWYRSGLRQTEVMMMLSQMRQFLIKKAEQTNCRELAHAYCRLLDMVTSVFNTFYQLMEERARIQQVIKDELKRFERNFHLLGLEMPKDLVKPYVAHQNWKVNVLDLALGLKRSEQMTELDETQCQLGQWLASGGIEKIPSTKQSAFLEDHRLIHEYGRQALKDAQNHHPEQILTYFNKMECASDRLGLVLLNLIEDEFIHLATSDHLTGLSNRRAFDQEFKRTLAFAERHQMWVGLIILDIDHFKQINDTYGHTVGDEVLQQFAKVLQTQIRTEEHPFRWGGEEFALLTMDKKPGGAEKLAERVRHAVETTDFQVEDQLSLKVTVSIGSLCFQPPLQLPNHEIFAKVDKLLYQAKENGRNQVVHKTIHNSKEV